MASEYAGISVPEGSPGELESLGSQLAGIAGSLEGASMRLRGLPGSMQSWSGPASVAFAETAYEQADAAHAGAVALTTARDAVLAYASDLREAKREAREAIREARDAKQRIREARTEIEEARERQAAAEARALQASISATTAIVTGGDAGSALADQAAAQQAAGDAAADLKRAKVKLQNAEDDLERAQRRGERAEQAAFTAEAQVVATYGAIGSAVPAVRMPGAPATAGGGGGGRPAIPGADRFMPKPLRGMDELGAPQADRQLVPVDELAASNTPLTLIDGALAGYGARQLQQQYVRDLRRVGAYHAWRALPLTSAQRAAVAASEARAVKALDNTTKARGDLLRSVKSVPGASLTGIGAVTQFAANHQEGMGTGENLVRTGFATAGGAIGGTAAGSACAGSVVLAPAAPLCGAGGALIGSAVGGVAGGVVYDIGDATYTHVLKPVGSTAGDVVDGLVDAVKR